MIIRDMIEKGLDQGIVNVISLDGDIACRIGEYWFYFAGHEGEMAPSLTSFLINIPKEDLIREIYDAISSLSALEGEATDEVQYYEWYLKEHLKEE